MPWNVRSNPLNMDNTRENRMANVNSAIPSSKPSSTICEARLSLSHARKRKLLPYVYGFGIYIRGESIEGKGSNDAIARRAVASGSESETPFLRPSTTLPDTSVEWYSKEL